MQEVNHDCRGCAVPVFLAAPGRKDVQHRDHRGRREKRWETQVISPIRYVEEKNTCSVSSGREQLRGSNCSNRKRLAHKPRVHSVSQLMAQKVLREIEPICRRKIRAAG